MLFKGPQLPFFYSLLAGGSDLAVVCPLKVLVKKAWSPVQQGGGALKVGAQGRSLGQRHPTLTRGLILAS